MNCYEARLEVLKITLRDLERKSVVFNVRRKHLESKVLTARTYADMRSVEFEVDKYISDLNSYNQKIETTKRLISNIYNEM